MKKQIFVINGSGGVGKDTFVSMVNGILYTEENLFCATWNYSSVEIIKDIAKRLGWDGSKSEKNRKFLSDLKLLVSEYNDLPFKTMCEIVDEFTYDFDTYVLFLHIREPEEIERAVKEFDAKTILVVRDSVEHITSNMADKNVYEYEYDYIIDNNGTIDDLREKARKFVKEHING